MSGSAGRGSLGRRKLLEFWIAILKRQACRRNRRAGKGTRALFEILESRVLLSAGVEGALVDTDLMSCHDLAQAPVTTEVAFLEVAHQSTLLVLSGSADPLPQLQADLLDGIGIRELVFLDKNLSDYQQLIADLQQKGCNRNFEVVELESDRNGIQQVTQALSKRSNLAAVHFITHGADGQINLGNSWLNNTTLQQNASAISAWGKALTETGDILFYGCRVAGGSDGQSLLNESDFLDFERFLPFNKLRVSPSTL